MRAHPSLSSSFFSPAAWPRTAAWRACPFILPAPAAAVFSQAPSMRHGPTTHRPSRRGLGRRRWRDPAACFSDCVPALMASPPAFGCVGQPDFETGCHGDFTASDESTPGDQGRGGSCRPCPSQSGWIATAVLAGTAIARGCDTHRRRCCWRHPASYDCRRGHE